MYLRVGEEIVEHVVHRFVTHLVGIHQVSIQRLEHKTRASAAA